LDGAGKSTVVAQWMGQPTMEVAPTFGFKIHTLSRDSTNSNDSISSTSSTNSNNSTDSAFQLHLWDIGGQRGIRSYWRNYFEETDGLVFVIDSAAPQRFSESLQELSTLLGQDRLANASVLVLANKQDCSGAIPPERIEENLKLNGLLGADDKTHWRLVGCSAITGQNVNEALDWLVDDIATRLYHKLLKR
jgi:ADP-ribosylation factor-like protein 2